MDTFYIVLAGLLGFLFIALTVGLILVILVQRPQGGGLSGAFGAGGGSTQSAFGAKTGDVLTIVTVAVFATLIVVACGLSLVQQRNWGGVANTIPIPPPPEKLVTELQEDGTVLLSWDDMSADETGFLVQRSLLDMEEWLDLETVARNETQYIDSEMLLEGSTYIYQVSSVSEGGTSEPCAESAVLIPVSETPENNSEAPVSNEGVDNFLNNPEVTIDSGTGPGEGAADSEPAANDNNQSSDTTEGPNPPATDNKEDK